MENQNFMEHIQKAYFLSVPQPSSNSQAIEVQHLPHINHHKVDSSL